MKVSIIMINYNTFELTKNAIKSVIKYSEELSYEIVLIDNASPDSSGARLKEYFKEKIIYIQADENLGTSKAFNLGVENSTGEYILWLNPDILFEDNFIKPLVEYMDTHQECGICGGNLVDFNGQPTHSFRKKHFDLKYYKKQHNFFFKALKKPFVKLLNEEYNYSNKPMEVGYITGADMMTRRDIIEKIGAFDERIFMYAEEVEYSFRVRKAGYKIMSIPSAKMKHLEGASFSGKISFNEKRTRFTILGQAMCYAIHYGNETSAKFVKFYIKNRLFYSRLLRFVNKRISNKLKLQANVAMSIKEEMKNKDIMSLSFK